MTTVTRSVPSPVGELLLVGDGTRLAGLYMADQRHRPVLAGAVEDPEAFTKAADQLDEWFIGERQEFDLELAVSGSSLQHEVWDALCEIPFGATATYGQVADRVGRPGAARAIGHAVGRNPLGIIVPCHRVIGADGTLTGYAGGLDRKTWLLGHERDVVQRTLHLF